MKPGEHNCCPSGCDPHEDTTARHESECARHNRRRYRPVVRRLRPGESECKDGVESDEGGEQPPIRLENLQERCGVRGDHLMVSKSRTATGGVTPDPAPRG
jgi:hypothetical protein